MLLLGGGFALAKAIDVSGLSYWIGSQLEVLDFLDPAVLCLIVCAGAAMATEVTSNVATANILLPVMAEVARATEVRFEHHSPRILTHTARSVCSR